VNSALKTISEVLSKDTIGLPVSGLYKWGCIHKAISKARGHSNYPQVDILLEITLDFAVVLQFNYIIWSVTNDYIFNGGQFPPEMCWRLAQKAIVDIRYKLLFAKSEKLTYGHLDTLLLLAAIL